MLSSRARVGALALLRARRAASSSSTSVAKQTERDPQLGDYPDPPAEFAGYRNPFGDAQGKWHDIQQRRQFNEPVPAEAEYLGMWSPDVPNVDPHTALRHFMIAVGLFLAYAALVPALQKESPVARRSYPFDGLSKELGGDDELNKARVEQVDDVE